MLLWLVLIFLIMGMLLGLGMLIWPAYFVRQTVYWNKLFLNVMGYEIQITPKPNAGMVIRFVGGCFVFIFMIGFSMGFDIFLMLFK